MQIHFLDSANTSPQGFISIYLLSPFKKKYSPAVGSCRRYQESVHKLYIKFQ